MKEPIECSICLSEISCDKHLNLKVEIMAAKIPPASKPPSRPPPSPPKKPDFLVVEPAAAAEPVLFVPDVALELVGLLLTE